MVTEAPTDAEGYLPLLQAAHGRITPPRTNRFSSRKIAFGTGIPNSTVYTTLTGRSRPQRETLMTLANYLCEDQAEVDRIMAAYDVGDAPRGVVRGEHLIAAGLHDVADAIRELASSLSLAREHD